MKRDDNDLPQQTFPAQTSAPLETDGSLSAPNLSALNTRETSALGTTSSEEHFPVSAPLRGQRHWQQQYKRLLSVQREAGVGYCSFSSPLRPGWCSPQFLSCTGMQAAQSGGECELGVRALLRRIHREDRQLIKIHLRSSALLQEGFSLALRLHGTNGSWRWVWARVQLKAVPGVAARLLASVMEISRQPHALPLESVCVAAAEILASGSARESMPELLQLLCKESGWLCATLWLQDQPNGPLLQAARWSLPDALLATFLDLSPRLVGDEPCQALLTPVLKRAHPVCLDNLQAHRGFSRAALAAQAGLRCALAVPVEAAGLVFGAIELFGRAPQEVDWDSLRSIQAIGRLTGQALRRDAMETALSEMQERSHELASQCFDSLTSRRELEEQIQHLAWHDPLTGLANRALFSRHMAEALERNGRQSKPFALMMLDLDRFKAVNDALGHHAGDRLLQEMGRRLQAAIPSGAIVARMGGDEFVVLVPEPSGVPQLARGILQAVEIDVPLEGQLVRITASIGISICPQDGTEEYALMKRADVAMYRAKAAGKNTWALYSATMDPYSAAQLSLESDLRRAIEQGELMLHYQPKVDARSWHVVGCEVLVRWAHPRLGLLHPEDFIPIAEETGLILPLTRWVLRHACDQNHAWRRMGLPPLRMAVNLSPRQFADPGLLTDVKTVLRETGMEPGLLELEITESMMMQDVRHARQLLLGLKALGVHISLDDFGVAYSALSHLKRFPIDYIKIDRSFIRGIPGTRADEAITEAIVTLSRNLRIGVVAEGVERKEQLQFLRSRGCDEIQGFLFSQPLAAAEFCELLQGRQQAPAMQ